MTSQTPNLVTHPSVTEPGDGIWFAMPAGFTALALDALVASPDSAESERFRKALEPVLSTAPDDESRQQFVTTLTAAQQMFQTLSNEGTVHCSVGLHNDDTETSDGGALLSMFTITWVDTSWAPRGVTAARAVTDAEGHAHIGYAELACGPASFSETLRIPTAASGLPREPLLQIYAHLPHPDATSLALLTLSTTSVARREEYRAILRTIAETVSFEDPFAPEAGETNAGGKAQRR
ncbi:MULTISPECIES: hypothetical protein [unclassified Streptomyces]|uniref:hypothetical protein n=1 Tax=unclassified Streptomyces TaxID=2593676 RepID=UPI0036E0E638